MDKLNLIQQKHAFTNQKKCTTTQHAKTTARFSHLLRHSAWKWRRPILISAFHKSVTYLLGHLTTYLQHGTHTGNHQEHWPKLFHSAVTGLFN